LVKGNKNYNYDEKKPALN